MKIFFIKKSFSLYQGIFLLGFFLVSTLLHAQVYTSTNFQVLDSVMTSGGGYASSTNYQIQSSIGQIITGTSTTASFGVNAGFEYFPFVSTPALGASAGDAQVTLSWTSASGFLGWNVGGYNVGKSTISGSGYTFTSVGNVNSAIMGSLTNNTTYYFVIQVLDTLGNVILTTSEVSATPIASTPPPPPPPSSVGGPSGPIGPIGTPTGVNFSGRAYPLSTVKIMKDGQLAISTIADPDANFSVSLTNLSTGNYTFSVYGEDAQGRRSSLFTFPIFISAGAVTNIGGIFLAPTIAVDKSEVKRGDNIAIFGQSIPDGDVTISIHSSPELFSQTKADKNGVYLLNFDTSPLALDTHTTKSKTAVNDKISPFSNIITFVVGDQNISQKESKTCLAKADLNCDGHVNLIDFSIAAYWYKKSLSSAFIKIEKDRLNGDGKVNLVDFSIMAYYWTG